MDKSESISEAFVPFLRGLSRTVVPFLAIIRQRSGTRRPLTGQLKTPWFPRRLKLHDQLLVHITMGDKALSIIVDPQTDGHPQSFFSRWTGRSTTVDFSSLPCTKFGASVQRYKQ